MLEEKKRFKSHGYGHFQVNCLNRRTLTIREVEEIQPIEEDANEEEFEEEDHTLVTPNIEELLIV